VSQKTIPKKEICSMDLLIMPLFSCIYFKIIIILLLAKQFWLVNNVNRMYYTCVAAVICWRTDNYGVRSGGVPFYFIVVFEPVTETVKLIAP
jgi:hypothetical protein